MAGSERGVHSAGLNQKVLQPAAPAVIVQVSMIGWLRYGQTLDLSAGTGIGLIAAGVMAMNVFSKATVH